MSTLIKLFVYKRITDDIHPVTKKNIVKTTYHTEPDGKGDRIRSIIGDGTGTYYAIKDAKGNRVMDKDTQAGFIRGNNSRLGNRDLKKISKRLNRFADRVLMMRKQVAKLTKEELLTEQQEQAILDMAEAFNQSIKTALLTPLQNTGGDDDDKEEPDVF
jgi:hypothetical protein